MAPAQSLSDDDEELGADASDQEVDVVGFAEGEGIEREKREASEATEHSSSFGYTFSGSDDEVTMSDEEVDSYFSVEKGEQQVSDGFNRLCKKRKVTVHWRNFISPLMWRCKWLELQMNELRSQASLYDKELAAYKREKHLRSKMIELDDSVSKSVSLTFERHRRAMKRRKRKRNEETVDISLYMSSHSIFSYSENKKAETDGHSVGDAYDNQVGDAMIGNDDRVQSMLGVRGADNSLEQIIFKIETLQSRVLNMETQLSEVDRITSKDTPSTAVTFLKGDPPSSQVQNSSLSLCNNSDAVALNGDVSTVSSYDEADVDMIESTAGLLVADALRDGHHIYSDIAAEDVLINNQAADAEDVKYFDKVICGREKLQEMPGEETESCPEDGDSARKMTARAAGASGELPLPMPCYTGKRRGRKPKRKRRGGSLGGFESERFKTRKLNR